MDHIHVSIAAINITERLSDEDASVPGVYSVMVQKGLSPETVASVALDVFHSERGVVATKIILAYRLAKTLSAPTRRCQIFIA